MGLRASKKIQYIGHGPTAERACKDLDAQLHKHFDTNIIMTLSGPNEIKMLSPRAIQQEAAVSIHGKHYGIKLQKIETNHVLASVYI